MLEMLEAPRGNSNMGLSHKNSPVPRKLLPAMDQVIKTLLVVLWSLQRGFLPPHGCSSRGRTRLPCVHESLHHKMTTPG